MCGVYSHRYGKELPSSTGGVGGFSGETVILRPLKIASQCILNDHGESFSHEEGSLVLPTLTLVLKILCLFLSNKSVEKQIGWKNYFL